MKPDTVDLLLQALAEAKSVERRARLTKRLIARAIDNELQTEEVTSDNDRRDTEGIEQERVEAQ